MDWDKRVQTTGNLIKVIVALVFFWKAWQRSHGNEPDAVTIKKGGYLVTTDENGRIIIVKDEPKAEGDLE